MAKWPYQVVPTMSRNILGRSELTTSTKWTHHIKQEVKVNQYERQNHTMDNGPRPSTPPAKYTRLPSTSVMLIHCDGVDDSNHDLEESVAPGGPTRPHMLGICIVGSSAVKLTSHQYNAMWLTLTTQFIYGICHKAQPQAASLGLYAPQARPRALIGPA